MKENKFGIYNILRPIFFLLPLFLGSPFVSYCLCAFNTAMTIIGGGAICGGIIAAVTAAAALLGCASLGLGVQYGLFFAIQILSVAVICAVCVIKRRSFRCGLLLCSAAYAATMLMCLKAQADSAGLSIADSLFSGFAMPSAESLDTLALQSGASSELLARSFEFTEKAIRMCMPSMIAVSAVIAAYAVMWPVSQVIRHTPLSNGHSFSQIRLPLSAVIYAALLAAALFIPNSSLRIVAVNGLLLFVFWAFAAGMSLADFLIRIKIKASAARVFIHIAIIFFGTLSALIFPLVNIFVIYAVGGITDCFMSIRGRVNTTYEKK